MFGQNESINSEEEFQRPKKSIILDTSTSSKKMISLAKSKEYSRLAQKAPHVFNVSSGEKYLDEHSLMMAGIKTGHSVQDKYQRSIQYLKKI